MVLLGKDLKGHLFPTFLLWAGTAFTRLCWELHPIWPWTHPWMGQVGVTILEFHWWKLIKINYWSSTFFTDVFTPGFLLKTKVTRSIVIHLLHIFHLCWFKRICCWKHYNQIFFTALAQTKCHHEGIHHPISFYPFLPKLMLAHKHTCFSQTTKMSSKDTKTDFYFGVRFLLVSQLVETTALKFKTDQFQILVLVFQLQKAHTDATNSTFL